jgi:hypothetical protein
MSTLVILLLLNCYFHVNSCNSIIIKLLIACQLLYPVVRVKYPVCSLLHWSLIRIFVQFSWEWCSSFAIFFKCKYERSEVEFLSAPYNFYTRRRLTADDSNQEIQVRSQLNSFAAFWVRLFTLLSGTRNGSAMPCVSRGQEESFLFSIEAQRILFEGLRNDSWHGRRENSFFYVTNSKLLRSVLRDNNSKTQYSWHLNKPART